MAIDLNNGYEELRRHVGHKIACVSYGTKGRRPAENVALECRDCNVILLDFDRVRNPVPLDLKVGQRVRLKRDVERFPHFIAPAGTTATVNYVNNDLITVRMDTVIEGAAEWDNDLLWTDDQLNAIGEDLERIENQQ